MSDTCEETVWDSNGWRSHRCTKPSGYGTDGKYCKIHIDVHNGETTAWYKVEIDSYKPFIREFKVITVNEKTLIIAGHNDKPERIKRTGHEYESKTEALNALITTLQRKIAPLREALDKAEVELRNPEALVYPFKEGDDYYTIDEDGDVVWSCWDSISEELYDENPDKRLFTTWEQAKVWRDAYFN